MVRGAGTAVTPSSSRESLPSGAPSPGGGPGPLAAVDYQGTAQQGDGAPALPLFQPATVAAHAGSVGFVEIVCERSTLVAKVAKTSFTRTKGGVECWGGREVCSCLNGKIWVSGCER